MWERGGMSHGTSIIDVRVTALDDALRCRCCRNIKVSLGHWLSKLQERSRHFSCFRVFVFSCFRVLVLVWKIEGTVGLLMGKYIKIIKCVSMRTNLWFWARCVRSERGITGSVLVLCLLMNGRYCRGGKATILGLVTYILPLSCIHSKPGPGKVPYRVTHTTTTTNNNTHTTKNQQRT